MGCNSFIIFLHSLGKTPEEYVSGLSPDAQKSTRSQTEDWIDIASHFLFKLHLSDMETGKSTSFHLKIRICYSNKVFIHIYTYV